MKCKILTVVAVLIVSAPLGLATEYQIVDLGEISTFAGEPFPLSVSNNGVVAGTMPHDSLPFTAFIWNFNSDLTIHITPETGNINRANDINDADQLVGSEADFAGFTYPFFWQNGIKTFLNIANGETGEAWALNNAGVVVGYIFTDPTSPSPLPTAALWPDPGTIVLLETAPGDSHNEARDINDNNKIVGYSAGSGFRQAVAWELNQPIAILDPLPGGVSAQANAINNQGQVVGCSLDTEDFWHAVIWQDTTALSLAPDANESWALAINDHNQVVGAFAVNSTLAFIWEEGLATSLNDLLTDNQGWILTEAHDINNSGWIVGVGINPDGHDNHGFLLVPLIVQETIPANIDIKPNTLNLRSKVPWLTCLVTLPEQYDIADVDPCSLTLQGAITPDRVQFDQEEQRLMAKFPRDDVQALFPPDPELVELIVTGNLTDGREFTGADTIRIINKTKK